MFPQKKTDILQFFIKITEEDENTFGTFIDAWDCLRCFTVLWGLEKPSKVHIRNQEKKRHILFAYKVLRLVWFLELPKQDLKIFQLLVAKKIPRGLTPMIVLDVFGKRTNDLISECNKLPQPAWVGNENYRSLMISIDMFPKDV